LVELSVEISASRSLWDIGRVILFDMIATVAGLPGIERVSLQDTYWEK